MRIAFRSHLARKRADGNVLVTAIFISVFLFFISVALVAQNRQNILLVLCEDHRVRATNAANAALDFALHVMRTNPNWRKLLPHQNGQLESGELWSIDSITYSAKQPHMLEVVGKGTSGVFTSYRTRVIEEVSLGNAQGNSSSSTEPSQPTHIFAYASDGVTQKLAVLHPDMTWHLNDSLPNASLPWLVADRGPVFTQAEATDQSFIIADVTEEGVMGTKLLSSANTPLLYYTITETSQGWSPNKQPCSWYQKADAIKKNDLRILAHNDTGKDGKLSDYREAQVDTTSGVYRGPCLEWYTLNGGAIAAHRMKVYAYGTHHYYQGTQAIIRNGKYNVTKYPKQYDQSALLCYDAETDSWSIAVDTMIVSSDNGAPHITKWNDMTPTPSVLAYEDGYLLSLAAANKSRLIKISAANYDDQWHLGNTIQGTSHGIYHYKGNLIYHTTESKFGVSGLIDFNRDLNLLESLHFTRAATSAAYSGESLVEVVPKYELIPSLAIVKNDGSGGGSYNGTNCVACFEDHLYTFVTLRASVGAINDGMQALSPNLLAHIQNVYKDANGRSITGLAHYAGPHQEGECALEGTWQIWPNGLYDTATNFTSNYDNNRLLSLGSVAPGFKLLCTHLAAGYYEAESVTDGLNRYSVFLDKER